MLSGKQLSVRSIVIFLAVAVCSATPLLAQNSSEDVHIQPRVQPTAPKEPDIDPAYKTHTKPLKVAVDMVLVPVTITDPLNRLVTGLDRDNFKPLRRQRSAGDQDFLQRRRSGLDRGNF